MKYKVVNKQHNSKLCIVCGMQNELGLRTQFYEMENGELVAIANVKEIHQSYPGRLHGGISAALLDETIGRAASINNPGIWGVTIELNTKYRKPVPHEGQIKVVGRITKETSRMFEGSGEIILENGEVAVQATGRYMKLPIEKIASFDTNHQSEEWFINEDENDPKEIEIN
ncbi:MAG: PaaI family thioesterase [Clostridium sp.]